MSRSQDPESFMHREDGNRIAFADAVRPHLNIWGTYQITRDEISEAAIRQFCEVAEDGNPVYWDAAFATKSRFGRLIAPPQSLFSMALNGGGWWSPDYVRERVASDAAALNPPGLQPWDGGAGGAGSPVHDLCDDYGYTVNTVAAHEIEFFEPFGPGDGRLKMRSMTIDVSGEKRVRVGRGVFITSLTEYRTEVDDRLVGRSRLVLLRYKPVRE
jgi:hypothetical protein